MTKFDDQDLDVPVQWGVADHRRLYWTAISRYEGCPQSYLWYYGHPKLDLGRGLGKGKPLPKVSATDRILGSVLAEVVEYIYSQKLWTEPKELRFRARQKAVSALEDLLTKSRSGDPRYYIDPKQSISEDQMASVVRTGTDNFVNLMKSGRLIGPYAESELDIHARIGKYLEIGGKPDLVIRDTEGNVYIYDGKNAKTPGKYEDPDQLRWYALVVYLAYGIMPKGLKFFYFRYPPGDPPKGADPSTWDGFQEVSCTKEDLERLALRAQATSKSIWKMSFPATPTPKVCDWCDFQTICPDRLEQKAENSSKRKPRVKSQPQESESNTYAPSGEFGFDVPIEDLNRNNRNGK